MQSINFHPDGYIKLTADFFEDWIIDNTLSSAMDRFGDPSSRSLKWRFRTSAAALAADVAASGSDWSALSLHLAAASREAGMEQEEVPAMLADAWKWGQANPTRWMALPRRWVFDLEAEEFIDVTNGVTLAVPAFDWAFSGLCPLAGWSTSDFLLCEGPVIEVDRVEFLAPRSARFVHVDDEVVLELPSDWTLN
ncbi:hypothetical protein A6F68_01052 [Tsuneonella dongtanensis]|uniref:Uncharacterized protein n=1 Tax=Tsuneonella dongtanensis TaxID=692370 RepID=A0A1B2ABP0_9SPHN|nr:hypothetical protein [Tsuneonella dongtanensis]ANY19573.1 hypothetical protein A6F68_01052 [Tsuneonella dongtanensis]